ncbi:MAG: KH domain-containing protein [Cyanobacteria bacterium P01_F01_bin.53]
MSSPDQETAPKTDFEALARFLMEPFLDKPEALKFHVETLAGGKKLWLRAAFDEAEDKGRIFGRGGRNINAMRTVITAAAKPADMRVNLSVFGEPEAERSDRGGRSGGRPSGGSRGRGRDNRPPRASTNPAPPKKKPKN